MITVDARHPTRTYLRDIWHYRDLFYILSWRDVKVRYKQTLIGGAWAVLRPLLTMLIFTFVFGRVAGLAEGEALPYGLLVLAGVLAWQLLSSGISEGASSLIGNERLITKVYFPRLILPLSTLATCLLDFLIALLLLVGLLVYYRTMPSLYALLLPLWALLALGLALGASLWLAAFNVRYRDFRYALPFVLQVGLFLSPVGFSASRVPAGWQWLYQLNPAVGLLESFRWCLFGDAYTAFEPQSVLITLLWSILLLFTGFRYFRHTERSFADHI
ncbi:MAG: ABC transporter permease [Lewinella sp.]|nr:ABC transporter permease [Lewinella sp.]